MPEKMFIQIMKVHSWPLGTEFCGPGDEHGLERGCRKIGDIKGTFHTKMGIIKYSNSRDLVDAKEIKKRWKDYMEELYKKDLNESITMMVWLVTQSQTFWNAKSSGP